MVLVQRGCGPEEANLTSPASSLMLDATCSNGDLSQNTIEYLKRR